MNLYPNKDLIFFYDPFPPVFVLDDSTKKGMTDDEGTDFQITPDRSRFVYMNIPRKLYL